MAIFYGRMAAGAWRDERGVNMIDGGAPWYDVYETADGKHVAIGALEQRFFDELLERLGLDLTDLPDRRDRSRWPQLRARLRDTFLQKTRDQWCEISKITMRVSRRCCRSVKRRCTGTIGRARPSSKPKA